MARKKSNPHTLGTVIDLQLAYRLIREHKADPSAFGWIPHPCYLCKGAGRILYKQDSRVYVCPKCNGECYGPQGEVLVRREFEILVGGAKGGGKAGPTFGATSSGILRGMVCTPFGFKRIADLRVGSLVNSPDGSMSEVIAVLPQGEQDLYKFTFVDGAETIVSPGHLWMAHIVGRKTKQDGRWFPSEEPIGNWKTYTTLQLLERLERADSSTATIRPNILIPLTEPVQFTINHKRAPWKEIPSYVLGVILGDGWCSGNDLMWCKPDDEIVEQIKLESGCEVSEYSNGKTKRIVNREYAEYYRYLGLAGLRSPEKFIPEPYMLAPLEERWSLIQGLMDTDGYIDDRGHPSFSTTSEKMAGQFQHIIRSLGFKATMCRKAAGYRKEDGEKVWCNDAFEIHLRGKYEDKLFRLSRKKDRVKPFNGGLGEVHRRITNIEKVGRDDCTCITVSKPNGLYLTDDFIVTHNSEVGRMFLIQGNPHLPNYTLDPAGQPVPNYVNQSYTYHPKYRGVIIRRNEKELDEWIEKAKPVYRLLGGEFFGTGSSGEFRFPDRTGKAEWGAKIQTGHLGDPRSYEKYQGVEIHRIVIEELTHIEYFRNYVNLRSCCRSTIPEIHPQILCTTNPLGRGHVWVMERFIEPKDEDGNVIPPRTPITERVTHPWTGKEITIDRVFIPANLRDNPSLLHDDAYVANLATLPEKERKAFLFGDWHIMSGQFFDMFRANGPLPGEPENASHVVRHDPSRQTDSLVIVPDDTIARVQWVKAAIEKSKRQGGTGEIDPAWTSTPHQFAGPNLHKRTIKGGYPYLAPWWKRAIGLDWGYMHNAAAYWGCRDPETHQVHVYRELCQTRVGSEELGARIAEMTYDDLRAYPGNTITLYVSPDAWQKRNRDAGIQSSVELLTMGMYKVLGPNSLYVPDLDKDMLAGLEAHHIHQAFDTAYLEFLRRVSEHKRSGITIQRANNNRILGWDWIRTMMNWEHPVTQLNKFDPLVYSKVAFEYGIEKAAEYASMFETDGTVRPLLQIWDLCPLLINSLPRAIHSETNPEDVDKTHFQDTESAMDCIDGLRYLLVGFKDTEAEMPFEEKRRRVLDDHFKYTPNPMPSDALWINRGLELDRSKLESSRRDGVRFGRAALAVGKLRDLNRYMN